MSYMNVPAARRAQNNADRLCIAVSVIAHELVMRPARCRHQIFSLEKADRPRARIRGCQEK